MPWDDPYYCTDEDVYLEAGVDYFELVPPAQVLARGPDGAIAAASPWVLSSAATDFAAQGVAAGDILRVTPPPGPAGATARGALGASGTAFAVDSVAGHAATLRLPGFAPGVGDPPGDPAANLAGLSYTARTLRPQIAQWSRWIAAQLDPDLAADSITDEDRRELARLAVLASRYTAAWRQAPVSGQNTSGDIWGDKAKAFLAARDDLLARLYARRRAGSAVDSIPVVPID
jgi:hypothetical protein